MKTFWRYRVWTLVPILGAASIFAAVALAGTGSKSGTDITYVANAGETNNISVSPGGSHEVLLSDSGASGGAVSSTSADCAAVVTTLDCSSVQPGTRWTAAAVPTPSATPARRAE